MSKSQWFKNNAGIIALIVTMIMGYIGSTVYLSNSASQQFQTLDAKIDHFNAVLTDKFGGLDTRTTKVEGAVKALSDVQNDPIKQIVHDLISSAAGSLPQDPRTATKALRAANSLIGQLKTNQRPADPSYFAETISSLELVSAKSRQKELRDSAFLARVSLAEYRSTLQSPPKQNLQPEVRPKDGLFFSLPNPPIQYARQTLDFRLVKGDALEVAPAAQGTVKFESVNIINAQIPLDGVQWHNVTFVDSHVIYRGGFTELQNVRFVNCTFEVPPTPAGVKVVDYAALDSGQLTIPS
jgi:hypothetical protein